MTGVPSRTLVILGLVLFVSHTRAAWVTGTVRSSEDFVYLAKFCFSDNADVSGTVYYRLKAGHPRTTVEGYRGEKDQWKAVYTDGLQCQAKREMSVLKGIEIPTNDFEVGEFKIGDQSRPAFYYFAGVNCLSEDWPNDTGSVSVEYSFHFTNPGGFLEREFSLDEQGFPVMYLVFFVAFTLMGCCQTISSLSLSRLNSFHMIVKFIGITVFFIWFSVLLDVFHYWIYAANGVGVPFFHFCALVFDMVFQLSFMGVLLLIGKGWTVSKSSVSGKQSLFVVMGMYLVTYAFLLLFDTLFGDTAATLYLYETWPGIIICILRIATCVWFGLCVYDTFTSEMHLGKRAFFKRVGILYVGWFLSLPMIVMISHFVNPWMRAKTVRGIELSFDFCSLLVLQFLLWPTRAAEYFQLTVQPGMGDDRDVELMGSGRYRESFDSNAPTSRKRQLSGGSALEQDEPRGSLSKESDVDVEGSVPLGAVAEDAGCEELRSIPKKQSDIIRTGSVGSDGGAQATRLMEDGYVTLRE